MNLTKKIIEVYITILPIEKKIFKINLKPNSKKRKRDENSGSWYVTSLENNYLELVGLDGKTKWKLEWHIKKNEKTFGWFPWSDESYKHHNQEYLVSFEDRLNLFILTRNYLNSKSIFKSEWELNYIVDWLKNGENSLEKYLKLNENGQSRIITEMIKKNHPYRLIKPIISKYITIYTAKEVIKSYDERINFNKYFKFKNWKCVTYHIENCKDENCEYNWCKILQHNLSCKNKQCDICSK
jgi:hypothetical protein